MQRLHAPYNRNNYENDDRNDDGNNDEYNDENGNEMIENDENSDDYDGYKNIFDTDLTYWRKV